MNKNSDVAICPDNENTLFVGSFDLEGELVITRIQRDGDEFEAISQWRSEMGLQTNNETVFRFAPGAFTENTRLAALDESILSLSDEELILWLHQAAQNQIAGIDGQLVFDFPLTEYPTDFARLPSGQISLTEISQKTLVDEQQKFYSALVPRQEALEYSELTLPPMGVETRLRSIMREASETLPEFRSLKGNETIALLVVSIEGAGFAFWSPAQGFFFETGEFFNLDVWGMEIPEGADRQSYVGQVYGERLNNFLNDQFYNRLFPDDEKQLPLNLQKVLWTATREVLEPMAKLIDTFGEQSQIDFDLLALAFEELVVAGLLLGTKDTTTQKVAAINLKNDLLAQAQQIIEQRQAEEEKINQGKRRLAAVFMFLPILVALGLVIGLTLNNSRIELGLASREQKAVSEKKRLQPILNERAEAEKTRAWFESILRQIINLRHKQPSSLSFAARLDSLIPNTSEFFISAMELKPGGDFEIQGYAKNQVSVSEFAKAMEFASYEQDKEDKRYFSNLALDFKQGSKGDGSAGLPSGVAEFTLKGNYGIASAIKTQTTEAKTAPNSTAPVTSSTPGNSSNPANNNTNAGNSNTGK